MKSIIFLPAVIVHAVRPAAQRTKAKQPFMFNLELQQQVSPNNKKNNMTFISV